MHLTTPSIFFIITLRTFPADVSTLNSTSDVQELGESHKGSCQTNANLTSQPSESTETSEHIKLHRWDPVRVGFEREIQLEVGKTHKIVTMSVRPPVFVIENYMEDFECDHIISKAQKAGLFSSQLHLDANIIQLKSKRGHIVNYVSNLDNFDFNQDGKLNLPEELLNMAYFVNYLYLSEKDVQDILEKFEIVISEEDGHNYVSRQDFRKINHQGLAEYLEYLREYHPRHRDRHSDQVWLDAHDKDDEIMAKLMRRLEIATGLHKEILHGTELIQVLRYSTHGHYHAHFDSQNKSSFPNFPCCHTVPFATADSCRLCRYMTALVYLNDVPKGGETSFPVADDPDYTHEEYLKRKKGDLYNLSQFCYNGSLVVSPKKGKLVMWYNHMINDEGMLGILDQHSLHGGCDVIEGEKWIANNWIPGPESPDLINKNIFKPRAYETDSKPSDAAKEDL